MAVVVLITQKSFSYRGAAEEYANVYHLSGTQPADQAAWQTLADAVKDLERPILPSSATWTTWLGYNEGSENADFTGAHTGTLTGSLVTTSLAPAPGDCAVWERWSTGDRSSTGKPIFLRKYFHPAYISTAGGDAVGTAQRTGLGSFGSGMVAGTLPGSMKVCRPNGHVGVTPLAATNVTTRTLKRRGRRPS